MPEPVGEDRNLKFSFHRAADYRVVTSNAVWGGVTPRGDILAEFAVESLENPETITNVVRADGALGAELSRTPKDRVIRRELQIGIIFTVTSAESLANWLMEKAAEIKRLSQDEQK